MPRVAPPERGASPCPPGSEPPALRPGAKPARASTQGGRGPARASSADEAPQAAGEEQPSLHKQGRALTFVNCTLADVLDAAQREHPHVRLYESFWSAVLTQRTAEQFRPLTNRTFAYWVGAFNKWLELRRAGECSARDMSINGHQLQSIFSLSKQSCRGIIELFDPEGFSQLSIGGDSGRALRHIIVSMPELATAGVLLSKLIPRRVKMNFLLGLFDLDDSGCLDEMQFTLFLRSFHQGLAAAFNVRQPTATVPELRRRAGELFGKAMDISALPGQPCDEPCGLCYETLWEWWCGKFSDSDSLSLPYKLVIQRFAPSTGMNVADCFDEDLESFRISHSKPIELKSEKETCSVHGSNLGMCTYLLGPVVLGARAIFEAAQGLDSWRQVAEQKVALKNALKGSKQLLDNAGLYTKLLRHLLDFCKRKGRPMGHIQGLDFVDFLRDLSPCASTKHFRMYLNHCDEQDKLELAAERAEIGAKAADVFAQNEAKPFLPANECLILRNEFKTLDTFDVGFITPTDMQLAWGFTKDAAIHAIESFDTSLDGVIDEDEFIRMMCPADHRLPEMVGRGRELVGQILESAKQSLQYRQSAADEYNTRKVGIDADLVPLAILPQVPDELPIEWGEVWDSLNKSGADRITVNDLEQTGLFCKDVCTSVVQIVDPDFENGFSRNGFIMALIKANGYRPRIEDAVQAPS